VNAQPQRNPRPPVWDRFVRFFHWSLVACFGTAWWFTEHIGLLHKGAGYAAAALVLARVVWGFIGSPNARFANFVPGPRGLLHYLGLLLRGREPVHAGHNPAGAVMILFLLVAVTGIAVSGWMMTLDAFWGNEWVETTHTRLVDLTVAAVFVHVLANLYGSRHPGNGLIRAMITGHKSSPPTEPSPCTRSDTPSSSAP
jgi:cytochrome b